MRGRPVYNARAMPVGLLVNAWFWCPSWQWTTFLTTSYARAGTGGRSATTRGRWEGAHQQHIPEGSASRRTLGPWLARTLSIDDAPPSTFRAPSTVTHAPADRDRERPRVRARAEIMLAGSKKRGRSTDMQGTVPAAGRTQARTESLPTSNHQSFWPPEPFESSKIQGSSPLR